jgi:RNA methyltransferase, TrmH family
MLEITSTQNPKIKEAVNLRDARERKRTGKMIVEGEREISLALKAGIVPEALFYSAELRTRGTGMPFSGISEDRVFAVPDNIFKKISARENPDGLLMIAAQPRIELEDLKLSANPLIIVLEAVEKPGNLGAVMRTADAAGADAVIIADPKCDIYNPNAVRASQGTIFTVPVIASDSKKVLEYLEKKNINIYSASLLERAIDYARADFKCPSALVFGTEAEGLSEFWLKAGQAIKIPMRGKIDSLNVSVTAGIIIFEALRQRKLN